MNLLQKIVAHKKDETAEHRELYPIKLLEQSLYFETPCVSLKKYLERDDRVGIIAEIKRQSPSHGPIHPYIEIEEVSIGYMQAGASALSILTDSHFFGGSNQDLSIARKYNFCPILRKDFIIDPYQVIEAKSIGADVILLIAAILNRDEILSLAKLAHGLGLEVLLEIHSQDELEQAPVDSIDVLGVNNRNLDSLKTDVDVSRELASMIPDGTTTISESGISDARTIIDLSGLGYDGFLIGGHFMAHSSPHSACADLIREVNSLQMSVQPSKVISHEN